MANAGVAVSCQLFCRLRIGARAVSRDHAEIEMPKASKGKGRVWVWGGDVPLSSRLGGLAWGRVVSFTSGVRGGDPAENEFWCI